MASAPPLSSSCAVLACLAEGLGIRGTARVFKVDPNTVLQWLVEAAEHLQAFSRHLLHDLHVNQVQLDELFALLSAVKDGEVSKAEAIERLERSFQWVWVAMDPESKLLLAIDVGNRTLAMAQRVVHQVAQVLAPDCAPLFLTDGFREYLTALLTHYGYWVHPSWHQATGPAPKPRWLPLPQLLYAQVVKTVRRRRLVSVTHRVVFGTPEAVQQVLASLGWQINTAFVERLNLNLRQHVAAVGRVSPRCARVRTVCGSNWRCIRPTITSACLMLPYASRCPSRYRPTGQAQRRCGGPVRRPWRWGSRIGSGRYVRCYCIACRRGHSPRRGMRRGSMMIVRVRGTAMPMGRGSGLK